MKITLYLFGLALILAQGVQGQSFTTIDTVQKGDQKVILKSIGTENLEPAAKYYDQRGENTPSAILEMHYADKSPEEAVKESRERQDLNNVKVIRTATYDAMSDEEKAAIDADPMTVVSDKPRKEVLVQLFVESHKDALDPEMIEKIENVDFSAPAAEKEKP